jgi:chromosome partitioning protein
MSSLVIEGRHVNGKLRACAILNLADSQGSDNISAAEALTMMVGVEALPVMIRRRKAFPNAFSDGYSVLEQKPKDPKAIKELLAVVDALHLNR